MAGNCYFETCIHYLPVQMSYDKVYTEFTNVVNDIAKSDPWMREHMPKITMYQSGGAFEQDEQASSVDALKAAYKEALGVEAKIVGSPAGCDSRLWNNITGSNVLMIGPGNLQQCHAVNEYVEMDPYFNAILVYAQFILTWAQKYK